MAAALILVSSILGWMLLALSAAGTLYMATASLLVRRFFAQARPAPMRDDPVTLLKPLHGAEPRLRANLESFLAQDHAGPVQMLCGIQRADDPAGGVVRALAQAGHQQIDLVIDSTAHGANGKVSNLINMDRRARHPVLVISDSDMAVAPDYLARLLAALDAPGVGAVTCLYYGRGDAGFWSRLGAAGLSYQFLPGAVFGVATGMAQPCMGSTIALRRDVLDRIGGFGRFADVLADDYAIGAAVRALGLRVAIPPMLVVHASAETSFADLWRHELRWATTVRDLLPGAYLASAIAMPVPLACLGLLLSHQPLIGGALLILALAARLMAVRQVDRVAGVVTASPIWLPVRDFLSFAVFVGAFFVRSVDWRGRRLKMEADGRIAPEPESSTR